MPSMEDLKKKNKIDIPKGAGNNTNTNYNEICY